VEEEAEFRSLGGYGVEEAEFRRRGGYVCGGGGV